VTLFKLPTHTTQPTESAEVQMETLFSRDSITALDFMQLAATFVLTMAVFFGQKNRRHWLNVFFIGVFILHWLNAMVFKPVPTKLLVTLLLMSVLIVEIVTVRREKSKVADNP
jgi:hypothetical protein